MHISSVMCLMMIVLFYLTYLSFYNLLMIEVLLVWFGSIGIMQVEFIMKFAVFGFSSDSRDGHKNRQIDIRIRKRRTNKHSACCLIAS